MGLVASSVNRFYVPRLRGDGNLKASYSGDGSLNDGAYDTSQHLVSLVCDQADSVVRAFNDGAAFSVTPTNSIRTGVTNNSNNAIGAFGEHGNRWDGSIQEIIVYDSDQSDNRYDIESSINDYYNIYYDSTTPIVGGIQAPVASAAYSLRSLDGDATANVVRLRRASDNEERDFTAADLAGSVEGAELVDNSNWTTTGSSTNWTINGSLISIDGTQTSQSVIRQDGIIEAKQYVLSFDVTCNDYSDLWIQYLGSTASRFYIHELGITTDGSYSLLLDLRGRDNPLFRFYVKQSGTQATLDNVSLKEYTPSVAEEWSWVPTWRAYTRQVHDTAYVTTLYDQAASNEQVFGDPTIQSPGDWTAFGTSSISQGLISIGPATGSFTVTYQGGDIQPGTYRLEVDYYGVTQANRIHVEGLLLPAGSGTVSGIVTVTSANSLNVGGYGAWSGQEGFITAIRVIDLGNTATQSTSTAQPKLITAGVTETDNGKPAMVFDGVDDYLVASSANIGATMSFFLVGVEKTVGGIDPFFGDDVRFYNSHVTVASGNSLFYAGTVANVWGDNGGAVQNLYSGLLSGGNGEGWRNGVQKMTSTAIGSDTITDLMLGWDTTINYGEINLQEFIIYPSDQSANRRNVETNINNHYNIY
jgi:hypothetical protein